MAYVIYYQGANGYRRYYNPQTGDDILALAEGYPSDCNTSLAFWLGAEAEEM